MSRGVWALLGVLWASCQAVAPAVGSRTLEVSELSVDFSEPGAGHLKFVVASAPSEVTAVRWNLELGGWRFASGLDGNPKRTVKGLEVDVPLAWRHLGWRDGARFLEVRITGAVLVGVDGAPMAYAGQREVLVRGSPVLDVAGD